MLLLGKLQIQILISQNKHFKRTYTPPTWQLIFLNGYNGIIYLTPIKNKIDEFIASVQSVNLAPFPLPICDS